MCFTHINATTLLFGESEPAVSAELTRLLDRRGKSLLHCHRLTLESLPSLKTLASLRQFVHPEWIQIVSCAAKDIPRLLEIVADGGRHIRGVRLLSTQFGLSSVDTIVNVGVFQPSSSNSPLTTDQAYFSQSTP